MQQYARDNFWWYDFCCIYKKKGFCMQKLLLFVIFPALIYASYNPFFSDASKPEAKKETVKIVTQKAKAKKIPQRKNIQITYFGFVHSKKGKFALINFMEKNIIVRENDSLYLDEQIFKVKKITSNSILLKDRYLRSQMVYFSSRKARESRQ